MKQRMSFIFILLNIVLVDSLNAEYIRIKDFIIDRGSYDKQVLYIKNTLKNNKDYYVKDNPEEFKKIITGVLHCQPVAVLELKQDGKYRICYQENVEWHYDGDRLFKIERGKWDVSNNSLILRPNGSQKDYYYEIKSYKLYYHEKLRFNKYSLHIDFQKPILKWGCDTVVVQFN
jgi:hypothetical protein